MRPETEQIKYIRNAFQTMKSKEELLDLLNYSKRILFGEKTLPFQLKTLTYYSNPKVATNRYVSFTIVKKSGKNRQIHAPIKGLKAIQRSLNLIFQVVFTPHPAATGFTNNKSITDNAFQHIGSNYVYNVDLKDFFPSVDQARVWKCLQLKPFNLTKESGRLELANIIAAICCSRMEVERLNNEGQWEKVTKNVLPQGAPTSPLITNVVCQKLDFLLSAVAKRFGLRYSRYADDITFSSLHNVYQTESAFIKEVDRIIAQQGFNINPEKTRLQKQGYRQEVTGLIVNEKVNVQSRYIKQLRSWLYLWETYGYDKAYNHFINDYLSDKGHVKNGQPDMINVILGKLEYLKMVKGNNNPSVLKYIERLNSIYLPSQLTGEGKIAEFIAKKPKVNHDPLGTSIFLKLFKYDNEFDFKKLVHKPIPGDNFDFQVILNNTHNQLYDILGLNQEKSRLPIAAISGVLDLFKLLNGEGLNYFKSTRKHPYEKPDILNSIQAFKRNYRFGNEQSESSILSTLIKNIVKNEQLSFIDSEKNVVKSFSESDSSNQFNFEQIVFLPDERKFQLKANFFTWVPNVKNGIWAIFDDILKHSNYYGSDTFTSTEKRIFIDLKRTFIDNKTSVALSILDSNSIPLKSTSELASDFWHSSIIRLFIGICDWRIQFDDIEGKSKEISILPYDHIIKELNSKVNGFKHILTFFD